jgi:hypothetical protein
MTSMFVRNCLVCFLVALFCVSNAYAATIFTIVETSSLSDDPDPSDWLSMVGSISTFVTEASNVVLADEILSTPTNNTYGLGGTTATLTFNSASTGMPWSFTVSSFGSTSPPDDTSGFTYNDDEGGPIYLTGTLSPGDIGQHENDDVIFTVTDGPALFGFGFDIVHSIANANTETVQVFGDGDVLLGTLIVPQHSANSPNPPTAGSDINLFVGITSDTPIKKVFFDEAASGDSGDDIAIRDFRFAAATIPESSTFTLATIALLVKGCQRGKRRWSSRD